MKQVGALKTIEIFKKYPGIILDGEGYKHGKSLQEINSVARTQVTAKDYEFLQFYNLRSKR